MRRKFTAVILLNVLAGLLFSCGEGVRLLPFPISEIAGNSQSHLQEKNKIPYQPNVLRFENGKGNYQAKIQRDNPHKLFSGDYKNSDELTLFSSENLHKFRIIFGLLNFKSGLFSKSKGSRAPPSFS